MEEYIKNILNQPDKVEIGQVWTSVDEGRDYLITNVIDNEKGIFRGVALTKMLMLNDGGDVEISKDENKFLFTNKLALRITDGPLHAKQLDFCLGKVNKETMGKILNSLNNRSFKYDEEQDYFISMILDELHYEHLEAVNLYEEALAEAEVSEPSPGAIIIDLSQYLKNEDTEKSTQDDFAVSKLAADDNSNIQRDFSIWEEIENSESIPVYQTDEVQIELVTHTSHLLLTVYSSIDTEINDIKLETQSKIIKAKPENIKVSANDRAYSLFDEKNLETGESKLTFTLNNNKLEKEILFK